ncbi:hypothetical protein HMPREF3223_01094 [Cutibacterium avidum]|nr:hypothetical protein HMPREF3223_01094 [Cutibacterium avidum]OIJ75762.1 hypothetical protein APY06_03290 [Cutibacterium avidum]
MEACQTLPCGGCSFPAQTLEILAASLLERMPRVAVYNCGSEQLRHRQIGLPVKPSLVDDALAIVEFDHEPRVSCGEVDVVLFLKTQIDVFSQQLSVAQFEGIQYWLQLASIAGSYRHPSCRHDSKATDF